MSAKLPKQLISIPEDCDPRSRYHRGGDHSAGSCGHHYVQHGWTRTYREWICLNCDRICGFYRWGTDGKSL